MHNCERLAFGDPYSGGWGTIIDLVLWYSSLLYCACIAACYFGC